MNDFIFNKCFEIIGRNILYNIVNLKTGIIMFHLPRRSSHNDVEARAEFLGTRLLY